MNKNINRYIVSAGVLGSLFLSANFIYAARLDDLIQQAQNRTEQAQQRIKQIRGNAEERIAAKREAIEQKISQIRDHAKRSAVERIADRLNHINIVWTDHFSNVLDRLDKVLQKIESRAEKASANGQDISQAKFAIYNAGQKIEAARLAVQTQVDKTYVVDATVVPDASSTSDAQSSLISKLREQFKTLRNQLFNDLTSLRDGAMKDARSSVQNAMQTLSSVPNVDEEPETN